MKAFMKRDLYVPRYDIDLREERELAYRRLKALCEAGFISVRDFKENPMRIFAAHEVAGLCDGSMATKMTVQFNLFGGTVLKLGTEKHHGKPPALGWRATVRCTVQQLTRTPIPPNRRVPRRD